MSIASGFTKMKNYILTSSGYKLLSRWTSSQTVHMGDGTDDTDTVEYRFGAMKGVTSSLATDNDEFALSASAGKNLQDQCTQLNQSLTLLNEGIQAVSKKQNFCKGSDRLLTDVLQIDFTNPTGESNSYGVIATEDASKLLNSPVTDGAFYAYREVLTIKSASKDYKVIVRLTEAYPSPGRIWIRMYNPDTSNWSGWKVI